MATIIYSFYLINKKAFNYKQKVFHKFANVRLIIYMKNVLFFMRALYLGSDLGMDHMDPEPCLKILKASCEDLKILFFNFRMLKKLNAEFISSYCLIDKISYNERIFHPVNDKKSFKGTYIIKLSI